MRSQLFIRGLCGLLGGIGAAVCGCITPYNTRLPTVAPTPVPVEKQLYQIHDPFPSESLGPDTMTRPPAFREPRAEPRKILEGRSLLGLPPGSSTGSFNYRNTVPQ